MDVVIFVEELCGLFLFVTGLAVLVRRREVLQIAESFRESPALTMLGGMFALVFGLGVVLTHNIWSMEPGVIVTALGWLSVLKGVALMIWPKAWMALMPTDAKRMTKVLGVEGVILEVFAIAVLWGAFASS